MKPQQLKPKIIKKITAKINPKPSKFLFKYKSLKILFIAFRGHKIKYESYKIPLLTHNLAQVGVGDL